MALRDPQALIATYARSGVLCLGSGARTCVAHGLPETPDTFDFQQIVGGVGAASLGQFMVESWDATSIVLVNSVAQSVRGYLQATVIHSISR